MSRKWIVAAACLSIALAGCSSSGSGDGSSAPSSVASHNTPATEDGLKTAAQEDFDLKYKGDAAETYNLLSKTCKAQYGSKDAWAANLKGAQKLFEAGLGVTYADLKLNGIDIMNFTPQKAATKYNFALPASAPPVDNITNVEWVYEDGGWRANSCGRTN